MIRFALALAVALPMLATSHASYASVGGITAKAEPATFDRSRPRVKGGSGCNSPRDRIEHPECR